LLTSHIWLSVIHDTPKKLALGSRNLCLYRFYQFSSMVCTIRSANLFAARVEPY
jgi:hypothetical protein